MAITGKTGADAVFAFLHKICGTLKRYDSKLRALIATAKAANLISAADADAANTFLDTSDLLCRIFEKLAGYSNVTGTEG